MRSAAFSDQHPSVDFATAITNVSDGGENQLVAYVLPKERMWMFPPRTNSRSICCAPAGIHDPGRLCAVAGASLVAEWED